MTEHPMHPAAERALRHLDAPGLVGALANLQRSDLTSLLLAVAARTAEGVDAPKALARYATDRFVRPGVSFEALRRVEESCVHAVPNDWDWVTLAPLLPFGAHRALGHTTQDWVIATMRGTEVAADPTVALALEAAGRRRSTSSRRAGEPQRLAAIQRITRGQRFESSDAFPHFTLFGLVTAGRSRPREAFDADALLEHVEVHVAALRPLVDGIEIVLSSGPGASGRRLVDSIRSAFRDTEVVDMAEDPVRIGAQRYYLRACFKIDVTVGDRRFEVGDGGFTDWTEQMLNDRRERLLISALGLDRVALALAS